MLDVSLFRVLALSDSGFPAGGFAHSGGLEAAASFGATREPEDVRAFVEDTIDQAACAQGPALVAAYRAAADGIDLARVLRDLDALVDARTSGAVTNRASRTQGRTFFGTASGIFPAETAPLAAAVKDLPYVHHAPVFGATMAALAIPLERAVSVYLFGQARGVLSAAVRLGLVGPSEGQTILDALGERLSAATTIAITTPLAEAANVSPLLELRAQLHDALYARLFLS